jgi:hypothetical protein
MFVKNNFMENYLSLKYKNIWWKAKIYKVQQNNYLEYILFENTKKDDRSTILNNNK